MCESMSGWISIERGMGGSVGGVGRGVAVMGGLV